MTQRTRYFLTVSALVITVGLGTGLVAYYNGGMLSRSNGPSEFAYVPTDSAALAFADVRTIMNSEFSQRLRQLLPTGEDKEKLQAELGLDIERDIDTVVASFYPGNTNEAGIVLVRGRFDDDMIETKAVQHGAKIETYRGKKLILGSHSETVQRDGATTELQKTGGVAVLEPGLLAMGDAVTLKRAIDAAADHKDITQNADMMKLVSDIQGTGNAWAVGRMDAVAQHGGIPEAAKTQISAVQWFSVVANVNGGLNGTLRAVTKDEQAATDLRTMVAGGLAGLRMMAGQDKRVEALTNSVQVQGQGTTVAVTFSLQPELLDLIAKTTGAPIGK